MGQTAYLSNKGKYTVFRYGEERLLFIGPYSLEYYDHVTEWDHGYISVMTKYRHAGELIEEYIDLIPIFENLYMDADSVLDTIDHVEVAKDV